VQRIAQDPRIFSRWINPFLSKLRVAADIAPALRSDSLAESSGIEIPLGCMAIIASSLGASALQEILAKNLFTSAPYQSKL
jgi:hypothetical protein